MSYLILGLSIVVAVLLVISRGIFFNHSDKINHRIKAPLDRMLKAAKFTPLIAIGVILVLIFSYFKSKGYIRLSHAFLVIDFWISSVIFYYITIVLIKIRKSVLLVPAVGMLISVFSAIYLTPLQHYENAFHYMNLVIPNIFGFILLAVFFNTNFKLLAKKDK